MICPFITGLLRSYNEGASVTSTGACPGKRVAELGRVGKRPCVAHSVGGCVLPVVPGRSAVPDEAVATLIWAIELAPSWLPTTGSSP